MAITTRWQLDPAHTTVELSVKHMMFTTVRGRFRAVSGVIELNEEDPDASHVRVEIDAASIDTGADARDTHLRSADFLDVERHPKLVFESKRVSGAAFQEGRRFDVVGDLTIRGVATEVTLEAAYQGAGKDPWGGERAGFSASTELDRRDWGLGWNQALETGGILVGNTVKVEIDVQAVKQQQAEAAAKDRRQQPSEQGA